MLKYPSAREAFLLRGSRELLKTIDLQRTLSPLPWTSINSQQEGESIEDFNSHKGKAAPATHRRISSFRLARLGIGGEWRSRFGVRAHLHT